MQEEASAELNLPAAQSKQPELEQEPPSSQVLVARLPAEQPLQAEEPELKASLPPGHTVQLDDPVFWEYFPAVQVSHASSPMLDWNSPSPQSAQDVCFVPAAFLPAGQSLHVERPLTDAYLPATQSSQEILDEVPTVPGEHFLHSVIRVEESGFGYSPEGQAVQETDPVLGATVPSPHASQVVFP